MAASAESGMLYPDAGAPRSTLPAESCDLARPPADFDNSRPASFQVLYFGEDTSHRIRVLVDAGYAVSQCSSARQLKAALQTSYPLDAILINEQDILCNQAFDTQIELVRYTRSATRSPLVLFCQPGSICDLDLFDLVIDTLTSPYVWLPGLRLLLEQCREVAHPQLMISGSDPREHYAELVRVSRHSRGSGTAGSTLPHLPGSSGN